MELLFRRGQSDDSWRRPKFDLWAKFEITPVEEDLILKYRVRNAILSEGDMRRDLFRALRYAALATAAVVLFAMITGMFPSVVLGLGILAYPVSTFIIYHQIREEIRVSDILDGRPFACRSVVTLMEKEETVKRMAVAFRHLLEALKNWGGSEIVEITPERPPTLKLVEPRDAAA
jgi:hypothetical protein